jgi:hypothetical protein
VPLGDGSNATLLTFRERGKRGGQGVLDHRLAVQERAAGRRRVSDHHRVERGGQFVHPSGARRVGRRRDDGLGPEQRADAHGERVGPTLVPAGERDRVAAGLVHADDARIGALVRQQRGDQPHGGAGGEEEHGGVQPGPQVGQLVERVQPGAEGGGDLRRGPPPGVGDGELGDHRGDLLAGSAISTVLSPRGV